MDVFEFEITESPDPNDVDLLTDGINEESVQFGSAYPFGIFARNSEGKVVAGCSGSIIFGSIYTDQLWVDPIFRKRGIGKKLMMAVHNYGKKH